MSVSVATDPTTKGQQITNPLNAVPWTRNRNQISSFEPQIPSSNMKASLSDLSQELVFIYINIYKNIYLIFLIFTRFLSTLDKTTDSLVIKTSILPLVFQSFQIKRLYSYPGIQSIQWQTKTFIFCPYFDEIEFISVLGFWPNLWWGRQNRVFLAGQPWRCGWRPGAHVKNRTRVAAHKFNRLNKSWRFVVISLRVRRRKGQKTTLRVYARF